MVLTLQSRKVSNEGKANTGCGISPDSINYLIANDELLIDLFVLVANAVTEREF